MILAHKSNRSVCICDTTYSLALYLFVMSLEDISNTEFWLGGTIDARIKEKLPCVFNIPQNWNWRTSLTYRIKFSLSRIVSHPKYVFAQDHISYADALIAQSQYILLEDSPGGYSQLDNVSFLTPHQPNKGRTLKQRIKYSLAHTSVYGNTFGTNKQCICRLVTEPKDIDCRYIKGKEYNLLSLMDLWKNSNEEKKNFILDVFSISQESVDESSKTDLLILTQPFVEDCALTKMEMVEMYQPYIEQYDNVMLKIHPRDHFDYLKYFPHVRILDNKAPMQLLSAIGMTFPVALTVCSTALSAMPCTTKRIYLGTKVNPKIYKVYGDLFNG